MKRLFIFMALILASGCSTAEETIIVVHVQDTVIRGDGVEVPAHSDMSGVIPVMKINKDNPECFAHELRHIFEGAWHGSEESNDCH